MIRIIIENILLFLLPTLFYVGYVLLTRDPDAEKRSSIGMRRCFGCSQPGRCSSSSSLVYFRLDVGTAGPTRTTSRRR